MAIYRCSRCDSLKDNDYDPCEEDPVIELGLMCVECAAETEEEVENPNPQLAQVSLGDHNDQLSIRTFKNNTLEKSFPKQNAVAWVSEPEPR